MVSYILQQQQELNTIEVFPAWEKEIKFVFVNQPP
jgi:hypothetical protein